MHRLESNCNDEAQLLTEHLTREENELHPLYSTLALTAVVSLSLSPPPLSSYIYESCQKFAINS